VTITYFDDANQRKRVSLEISIDEAMNVNASLRDAVKKAQAEYWDSLPLEMKCGDFSIRFLARLIDGVILGLVNWILRVLWGARLGGCFNPWIHRVGRAPRLSAPLREKARMPRAVHGDEWPM
jgi:hypothetical protein